MIFFLISILLAIVFFILVVKAIFETICGISMAIYALFMMLIVAPSLDLTAFVVRMFSKTQPKAKAVKRNLGYAGAIRFGSMK